MFSLRKLAVRRNYTPDCCSRYLKCLLSTSSRPIANFDSIEETLASNDGETQQNFVSVKHHPGMVSNRRTIRLPDSLTEAAQKISRNRIGVNLQKSAKDLKNHLMFKKPPLTESQLKQLKASCAESMLETHPIPDTSYLTAEDEKRVLNRQDSILRRTLDQKAYKWKPVVYDTTTSFAYMLARLAPDYASLYQIFSEIHGRDQNFKPQTLFDFGAGLGAALWAAKSCWNMKKFSEVLCVDSSIDMNNLALGLIQGGILPSTGSDEEAEEEEMTPKQNTSPDSNLKGLHFRQFMPTSNAVKYDLVVCGHTLLELPSAEVRLQTALSLWRKSQGYLVFVEHGSRAAYEVLMEIRDFLLTLSESGKEPNLEGYVFAPCPNQTYCPRLSDSTPCNFEVKYQPLFENDKVSTERFSYLVFKKGSRPDNDPLWPRVVRPVLARSGHTVCRLCTKEGTLEEVVITRSKHSRMAYKCSRVTKWGDLLPAELSRDSSDGKRPAEDQESTTEN